MAKQDRSIGLGICDNLRPIGSIDYWRFCQNRHVLLWLLLIPLLLLTLSSSWAQWELKLRGGKWDRSINLVHFITPEQGWAVGVLTSFWTEDGGETWTHRDLKIWPTASFPNALDGWQLCSQGQFCVEGPYPPIGAKILFQRSFDGGLSWVETAGTVIEVIEMNAPPRPAEVRRFGIDSSQFYFLDSQTGFAAGSTWLYGGMPDTRDAFRANYIAKTTDGGNFWTLYLHWGKWNTWGSISEIKFFDAKSGWVLVDGPDILYRTHDGGQTWQYQMLQMSPLSIEFSTPMEGWMTSSRSEVWFTLDGGQAWGLMARVRGGAVRDIEFISPHEGWMALFGLAIASDFGLDDVFSGIIHTKDGGRTWEVELDVTSDVKIDIKNSVSSFIYDALTRTLWAKGGFGTLYKRTTPVVGVFPRGKTVLTWSQLKKP